MLLDFLLSQFFLLLYSSKGGTQCKRALKKGEEVRPHDTPGPAEEMEKNQKILLWLMEGQKEMVQHKKSPYGSVTAVHFMSAHTFLSYRIEGRHALQPQLCH